MAVVKWNCFCLELETEQMTRNGMVLSGEEMTLPTTTILLLKALCCLYCRFTCGEADSSRRGKLIFFLQSQGKFNFRPERRFGGGGLSLMVHFLCLGKPLSVHRYCTSFLQYRSDVSAGFCAYPACRGGTKLHT